MKKIFERLLPERLSLKYTMLIMTIAPMTIAFCIFAYLSLSAIASLGDKRIEAYRESLIAEKKKVLKNYTDIAINAIEGLPQKQAREHIKLLRYANNDYFWINDLNAFMVSHPDPRLDGKDMSDLKDPNGVYIIREIVKTVRDNGEGYVSYQWRTIKDEKMQPKLLMQS